VTKAYPQSMAGIDHGAAARDHLWLHFTRMQDYEVPVIVRGEGCYLYDDRGKRYLDALAGLFAVNIGYCASCRTTRTGRTRTRGRSSSPRASTS